MKLNLFRRKEKEPSLEDLPQLWDEYCRQGYEKVYLTHSTKNVASTMQDFFEPQEGGIVLDAGCGTGSLLEHISEKIRPSHIVAVDWSEEMLKKSAQKVDYLQSKFPITLQKADLTKPFPWVEHSFDAVVANLVLCYLPHPGWRHALKEASRVLKPNGNLYLSTFSRGWTAWTAASRFAPREFVKSPLGTLYGVKFARIAEKIVKIAKRHGAEFPQVDELVDYLRALNFDNIMTSPIYWNLGVAVKAKK